MVKSKHCTTTGGIKIQLEALEMRDKARERKNSSHHYRHFCQREVAAFAYELDGSKNTIREIKCSQKQSGAKKTSIPGMELV